MIGYTLAGNIAYYIQQKCLLLMYKQDMYRRLRRDKETFYSGLPTHQLFAPTAHMRPNYCFSTITTHPPVALLVEKSTFATLWITGLVALYMIIQQPNALLGQEARWLFIYKNTTFTTLKDKLYQERYIANKTTFKYMAWLARYGAHVLPGAYKLTPGMSNWEMIQLLRKGKQEPVKVILHNIANKEDLAAKITHPLALAPADFYNLLMDANFLQRYGFTPENVLSMFIPDTYHVYWTISAEKLFDRMHQEYQRFWNQTRRKKAKQSNLSPIEVSILAAIVERETNKADEALMIAGVYINRIHRGMKLQSCPTILYIANDPTATRVLHTYLQIDSPYNTYLYKGLPPGPITLPSIQSIDAVLDHQKHSYLYFVAKEDFSGYHYFSTTFQEHQEKAKRYRKAIQQWAAAKKKQVGSM
eukprot:gene2985-3727_t